MDREEAIAAFTTLERTTYSYVDDNADHDDWVDENTPPTAMAPVFDVRLDAGLDNSEDRAWRIFVRFARYIAAPEDHIGTIVEAAKVAGARAQFENDGVELA